VERGEWYLFTGTESGVDSLVHNNIAKGTNYGSKETSSTCETGRKGRSQGRCARQIGSQAEEGQVSFRGL
jgi:hypothetical protein